MLKLLQVSVATAVICANIKYEWTPNGYLAALLGGLAAFLVTWIPWKIYHLTRSVHFYLNARFGHESLDKSRAGRIQRVQRWR